ncbi:MAG: hypothetical protein HY002_19700 [Candidatus Rokubacteria bacterium]|nr:hypothetical protein [Candidatus Rokubacteria bacterium]
MTAKTPALIAALVVGLAAAVQITPIVDYDLWWLLKAGEHMVATRALLATDPFSWTAPGAFWLNHAWGFELTLYGVYALAGFSGLIALQALFALATFAVMAWTLRREAVPMPWTLVLIGVAALTTRGFWSPRPQVMTYLGLAVLWAIVRDYQGGRSDRLGWLPVLTVAWVNLHGGFLIGLAVLGLATLGQAADRLFDAGEAAPKPPDLRRMGLIGLACLGVALLNPFHVRALLFPFGVAADQAAKELIIEWFSPAFQYPQLRLFEGLLLFFLVIQPAARLRPRLADLATLVVFVYLALDATRNIPLFVIVLTPLAGRLGAAAWARVRPSFQAPGEGRRARAWAAAGLLGLIALAGARDLGQLSIRSLLPVWGVADVFPARAADFLLAHPLSGRLFNDYGWGGYLTWRLFPRYRMFIDGRVAVFPPDVREDFLTITNGRSGWREALDRREIGLLLIRNGTQLAALVRETAGWVVAYEDRHAVIFRRVGTPA